MCHLLMHLSSTPRLLPVPTVHEKNNSKLSYANLETRDDDDDDLAAVNNLHRAKHLKLNPLNGLEHEKNIMAVPLHLV